MSSLPQLETSEEGQMIMGRLQVGFPSTPAVTRTHSDAIVWKVLPRLQQAAEAEEAAEAAEAAEAPSLAWTAQNGDHDHDHQP
jgi:hypothetical protein